MQHLCNFDHSLTLRFCSIFPADRNKLFSSSSEESENLLFATRVSKSEIFKENTYRGCIQETEIATSHPHLRSDIKVVPRLRPTFHRGGPEFNPKKFYVGFVLGEVVLGQGSSEYFGFPLSTSFQQ